MKTKFIKAAIPTLVVIVISCSACNAQKMNAAKVPATVKESFTKSFSDATGVKWELENKNYEANFKQDGKAMSAVIDSKGTLLETETDIKISELPATVTGYIAMHYKGAKIKEAAIIKKADGEMNYEAEVNHKDVLFNSKGEFIKEVKD